MSKRKSKPVGHSKAVRVAGLNQASAARASYGHERYGTGKTPARRLKCSHCPRTRPFSFDALHAVCPTCKTGRWG